MSKLLVAAGNYEIHQQVKSALGTGYYDMSFAYSHHDALYMMRAESVDAVLIDSAMLDRHTGEKSYIALSKLDSPPAIIAYVPMSSPLPAPINTVRAPVVFVRHLEQTPLLQALSEAMRVPVPALDDSNPLFDTSPKHFMLWRDDEIQTLFALSRSLTEVLDSNEVLHRVVQAARHLTEADEGILLMPDGDTGQFYLRAEAGVDSDMSQTFRVKLQDSYAGQVFSTGEPILIGMGGPHKVKTQYFVNSLLYVPITLKGERIGVLGVSNRYKRTVFNRRHQELLTHLASYSAIAIENARVHGLSIERAQDLHSLVQASQAINSSLSMEATLRNMCEQLGTLLGGSRVDIVYWKPRKSIAPHEDGKKTDSEPPPLVTLARYRNLMWRVGYAPDISLKSRPALVAALRNKVVMVSVDRAELPDEIEALRAVGAHALIAVPLMVENQPLGLLLAYYHRTPITPSPDVLHKAQSVGVELLANKVDSSHGINAAALQQAREINQLMGAAWVEFALLGQDRRSLITLMSTGFSVWLTQPYSDPLLEEHAHIVNILGEQQIVHATANMNTSTLGSLAMLDALHGRAMLGVPLIAHGETIGFILIINADQPRPFTEREINLARALGLQAASALQNADLMHQLQVSYHDLKTAQERLVRAARLTAMGELAGAVAHQINNPLTTIVLDAELMLLNPNMQGKARESLEAILRSGKRAASVVRRLLTTVQPDRRKNAVRLNVIETVEETISLVRTHVQKEAVQVRLALHVDETPHVVALREDLNDLWLNLLLNAYDSLHARLNPEMGVEVRHRSGDAWVEVTVWDNGHGIPDENVDRIFEPFFTTKPPGEGTGLGLHICRQIVDRLGGTVRVNSQTNIGTKFVIRLPVVKE